MSISSTNGPREPSQTSRLSADEKKLALFRQQKALLDTFLSSRAIKIIKANFTRKIFNIFSNYGSLLQIDFSEKKSKGNNIFIYMCNWRICHDSIELLTSNDDRMKFDNIFELLIHDGIEVIDLVFNRENHEFSFYLRNNYSMTIFPNNDSVTDDMIIFFIEDRQPICYNIQKGFYSGN